MTFWSYFVEITTARDQRRLISNFWEITTSKAVVPKLVNVHATLVAKSIHKRFARFVGTDLKQEEIV